MIPKYLQVGFFNKVCKDKLFFEVNKCFTKKLQYKIHKGITANCPNFYKSVSPFVKMRAIHSLHANHNKSSND